MKKCWFKIISTLKNTPNTIIPINIYFSTIIHISRNQHIKFIVFGLFFSYTELRNVDHAFKFTLQKGTDLFFPVRYCNESMTQNYQNNSQ